MHGNHIFRSPRCERCARPSSSTGAELDPGHRISASQLCTILQLAGCTEKQKNVCVWLNERFESHAFVRRVRPQNVRTWIDQAARAAHDVRRVRRAVPRRSLGRVSGSPSLAKEWGSCGHLRLDCSRSRFRTAGPYRCEVRRRARAPTGAAATTMTSAARRSSSGVRCPTRRRRSAAQARAAACGSSRACGALCLADRSVACAGPVSCAHRAPHGASCRRACDPGLAERAQRRVTADPDGTASRPLPLSFSNSRDPSPPSRLHPTTRAL